MLPYKITEEIDRLADEAYKIARRRPRRSVAPITSYSGDANDKNGDGSSDGDSNSGRDDVCDEGVRKRE